MGGHVPFEGLEGRMRGKARLGRNRGLHVLIEHTIANGGWVSVSCVSLSMYGWAWSDTKATLVVSMGANVATWRKGEAWMFGFNGGKGSAGVCA